MNTLGPGRPSGYCLCSLGVDMSIYIAINISNDNAIRAKLSLIGILDYSRSQSRAVTNIDVSRSTFDMINAGRSTSIAEHASTTQRLRPLS